MTLANDTRDAIDADRTRELLSAMTFIRRFEEKAAELYSAGKIRGFLHLCVGEEAVAVGVMRALTPEDRVVSTYREHGHALARGISPSSIMAEMYGKVEGCSHGRGGSMHLFDERARFYGGNAIVGGRIADSGRARARGPDAETTAGHGVPLRRRGGSGRRVPRVAQSRRALEAAGGFCLREQLVRHGHGARSVAVADRPARRRRARTTCRPRPSTAWTSRPSTGRRRPRSRRRARARGPRSWSFEPTGFAPTRCSTRSFTGAKRRSSSGNGGTPSKPTRRSSPSAAFSRAGGLERMRADADVRIAEAAAFAEKGTWEPVVSLTDNVYAPGSDHAGG